MRLILFNVVFLFGVSFVLHVFLLGIIQLGVFGINLSLCLNNLSKDIKLSGQEKEMLLKNLNEILINSDPMTASDYIKETVSSFDDAFPNYNSDNESLGILNKYSSYTDIFKKRFNLDKAIEDKNVNLEGVFKNNGIILGLDIMNNNSKLIEEIDNSNRLNDAIKTLDNFIGNNLNENLKKSLNDVEDKHIKIIVDKENMEKMEVLVNYGKEVIDILKKSDVQSYIQIGAGAFALISTTLVYRMLIKTYSEVVYKGHNYENLSEIQKTIKLNARSKDVKRFALFTGPVIVGLLLVISNKFPSKHSLDIATNTNIELNDSSSKVESIKNASLISIMTNKFKNIKWNWLKLLNFSILFLIITGFSLKYIFHINDTDNLILIQIFSIKKYIYSNIFYIKSFLIIWLIG